MLKKLLLFFALIVLGYLYIQPLVFVDDTKAELPNFEFKKGRSFSLRQFVPPKSDRIKAYLIIDNDDFSTLPTGIKPYRILRAKDEALIQQLLDLKMTFTGADIATTSSRLVICANGNLVYEAGVSFDYRPGLQNSSHGWATFKDEARFIKICSQFKRHFSPLLMLN
ncbi:MAG: hypothetical protein REI78_06050 [Pedobacter sp.]|nr:hypothetical protein [Pedobacter sp.]MDQ8052566.1 hypothetical protein [Pedobacter sp.]